MLIRLLIFLFSLILLHSIAFASSVRMERRAFLRTPVFSTQQLVDQVRSDPLVLRRFQSHFKGVTQRQIEQYFSGLRIMPLRRTSRYLVFNVDQNLVVRSRLLRLRAGTQVFADARRKPILKRSCGNPMVARLDMPTIAQNLAEIPQTVTDLTAETISEGAPFVPMAEEPIEASSVGALEELQSFEPGPPSANLIEDALHDLGAPTIPSATPAVWFPTLPPLILFTDEVKPIPEPATILGVGLGLAAVLARRRQRTK